MDHLKRPIEIEILCLKNEISLLILACVAGRFVMCWAFSLWDGEIKFDLHPNFWLVLPKTTARPPLIPPAGYNWIKMVSTEKIIKKLKLL